MGKIPRLAIVLAGARLFCLGVLAFLLSSPFDSSVGAVTFAFSGFQENSLYSVPDGIWIFEPDTGCFCYKFTKSSSFSGRLLYPFAVQMIDPNSTTVKSFSTSFIYRFGRVLGPGPGMAFITVPDNSTLGGPGDFMGLITNGTGKNQESDDHTLGVELDTFMNPEFNDNNDNHIGINLASMNSTRTIRPGSILTPKKTYQQIWIDYSQANSRMDIYFAKDKERKPDTPQGSLTGLDLSLLKENMYIGFSSSNMGKRFMVPYVCAWSFSNDGSPAPSIVMAQVVGKEKNLWILVGVPVSLIVSVGMLICIIVSICWCRFVSRPLRIFISHAGGPNGYQKNFPTWLDERMRTYRWSVAKSRVKIFFDTEDVEMDKSIAKKILRELARFDLGVVVVTNAFFVAKWPMTELIALVEAQTNDSTGRIRVLPLFYDLSPKEVKAHLDDKTWEGKWEEMSKGNHPLQVEQCRAAVTWLCQQRGIPYGYEGRHHDKDYIETICKRVDEILCKERSFASYLIGAVKTYCIPSHSQPGKTTPRN